MTFPRRLLPICSTLEVQEGTDNNSRQSFKNIFFDVFFTFGSLQSPQCIPGDLEAKLGPEGAISRKIHDFSRL